MKIIVGITGATGAILGIRLLEALRESSVETHLVVSRWAEKTIRLETNYQLDEVYDLATVVHREENQAASIASGSFLTDGMVIAPCSMKTLAGIRMGYAESLLGRAADVILKERRKLVLLIRETPLSTIHLENMLDLSRMGVVIFPPVLTFYNRPQSTDDIINHIAGRTLDQFGIQPDWVQRWGLKSMSQQSCIANRDP
ncbi:UbiX family flavin prenyltransferase [Alicyclobacillus suci]|uniref:UbiX family flavin prenyltransferase n=1 Tax=Alicyclobacillus suci TaxID=2816080 RepID=UPI001A8DE9C5|nr:UbiX family flavin prenyltransferase [Alicyclobacillus suci]